MLDGYGREINYLRISVTQNCNLNCIYCSPAEPGVHNLPPSSCREYLTPNEIGFITGTMAGLGLKKVRITGGEPLLRPDLTEIIAKIAEIKSISEIAMTTNGLHLAEMAEPLKEAGLKRVNISIDSLNSDKFSEITGGGNLKRVLNGLEAAIKTGLSPVKINVVLIKGVNDGEIDDFIGLTKEYPIDIRFIELMPLGSFSTEYFNRIIYSAEIIGVRPRLQKISDNGKQVAEYYQIFGYKGRIGFISPMSHKFCGTCNRVRITCDGKLKLCLGNNNEINILPVLRNEPAKLSGFLQKTILKKPFEHHLDCGFVSNRTMAAIGG